MFSLTSIGLEAATIKTLAVAYIVFGTVLFVICLLLNVLQSIGIYEMSKNASIENSWYAFVPILKSLALGQLADAHRSSKSKKSGKIMIILNIVAVVLFFAGFIAAILTVIDAVFKADAAILNNSTLDASSVKGLLFSMILLCSAVVVFLIFEFFKYVCVFKIFDTFARENAIVYLILSIILPFLLPLFIFAVRKNKMFSFKNLIDYREEEI